MRSENEKVAFVIGKPLKCWGSCPLYFCPPDFGQSSCMASGRIIGFGGKDLETNEKAFYGDPVPNWCPLVTLQKGICRGYDGNTYLAYFVPTNAVQCEVLEEEKPIMPELAQIGNAFEKFCRGYPHE